ncbi:5-methyltetrahydropteroyltriglutamate--homocysteine S-methyltransferase [Acetilactobacillus jinshanensis]|uniref:5-methyltetrahydropteroyltriglutamate--homocysteine S-methyltransferase n=1 Tax=Acetilactobacillus jinshanensis TaxID=1720083 RepID=A0A4P6ZL82_9LACO|nr:5-methyltetrahydropteroyltriglutamate--homocysteine S-methyltransferase [Acetilactobacillus jinshanensis]QBP18428.1 5-methyltetrahydropteroyltriglutamate--homocysteine S-methyltransferase [Acetilactobacillus jinshanensis]URL61300.1 5-methyltetrahydropteroyltriglutamate--homocysteine S-methyltransferase [uncultured bacterium]
MPKYNHQYLHYDIVGSFLRPKPLKSARQAYREHRITHEDLTQVEDAEIAKLVRKEINSGLKIVTDGEFRRNNCFLDTVAGFNGIEKTGQYNVIPFKNDPLKVPAIKVTGKISFNPNHPDLKAFKYLHELTADEPVIPRQSIPAPAQFYSMLALDKKCFASLKQYYSDIRSFINDLGKAYHDLIMVLYHAGCRDLKLDDCTWAALCSSTFWKIIGKGRSRKATKRLTLKLDNAALKDLPKDLNLSTHVCRGNFASHWMTSGGYEYVAPCLFNREKLNQFFLEFDDDRSGGFEPLKHANNNDQIILGLITSKRPQLENSDHLIDRIHQASKYVPIQNLGLSPQCGFASTEEGNHLTEQQQWAKIRLMVNTAQKVWN